MRTRQDQHPFPLHTSTLRPRQAPGTRHPRQHEHHPPRTRHRSRALSQGQRARARARARARCTVRSEYTVSKGISISLGRMDPCRSINDKGKCNDDDYVWKVFISSSMSMSTFLAVFVIASIASSITASEEDLTRLHSAFMRWSHPGG